MEALPLTDSRARARYWPGLLSVCMTTLVSIGNMNGSVPRTSIHIEITCLNAVSGTVSPAEILHV